MALPLSRGARGGARGAPTPWARGGSIGIAVGMDDPPLPSEPLAQPDWLRGDWREALVESIHRLERRLETVRERPMRRTVVCDAVLALEGPGLVAFLGLLLERSRAGNGRARAGL